MIYKPTKEEVELAYNFAKEAVDYHLSKGRSKAQVIKDITIGKLAELSFLRLEPSVKLDSFSMDVTEDPDPGWDLVLENGDRVQVKSITPNGQWISFGNWYWEELVVFEYESGEFRLIARLSQSEVRKMAKKSKYKGWYLDATADISRDRR